MPGKRVLGFKDREGISKERMVVKGDLRTRWEAELRNAGFVGSQTTGGEGLEELYDCTTNSTQGNRLHVIMEW